MLLASSSSDEERLRLAHAQRAQRARREARALLGLACTDVLPRLATASMRAWARGAGVFELARSLELDDDDARALSPLIDEGAPHERAQRPSPFLLGLPGDSNARFELLRGLLDRSLRGRAYDARMRVVLRGLAGALAVPWLQLGQAEDEIATAVLAGASAPVAVPADAPAISSVGASAILSAGESAAALAPAPVSLLLAGKNVASEHALPSDTASRAWRFAQVAGVATVGAGLLAITGGLAAPALLAGAASLAASIGVASLTAVTTTASALAASTVGSGGIFIAFGAYGARLAGASMLRRIGGLDTFRFEALSPEAALSDEGRAVLKHVRAGLGVAEPAIPGKATACVLAIVCVSGVVAHAAAPVPFGDGSSLAAVDSISAGANESRSFTLPFGGYESADPRLHGLVYEADVVAAAAAEAAASAASAEEAADEEAAEQAVAEAAEAEAAKAAALKSEGSGGSAASATLSQLTSFFNRLAVASGGAMRSRRGWLRARVPYGDLSAVVFDPAIVFALGLTLTAFARQYAKSQAFAAAVTHTMLSAAAPLLVAWSAPSLLASRFRLIDTDMATALDRASKAGVALATTLLIEHARSHRPVTLLGFSLGARTVFSCLAELARVRKEKGADAVQGIICDAFLLGAPECASEAQWKEVREVVCGRLVNAYSRTDFVLRFSYRLHSLAWACAGLRPIGAEHGSLEDLAGEVLRVPDPLVVLPRLSASSSSSSAASAAPAPALPGSYSFAAADTSSMTAAPAPAAPASAAPFMWCDIESHDVTHIARGHLEYGTKLEELCSYLRFERE